MKPYVNKILGSEPKKEENTTQKDQIKNNIQFIQQMDSNK